MAEPDLFQGFLPGDGKVAADAGLAQNDLGVLQGDGIIVDDEHVQLTRLNVSRRKGRMAVGLAEGDRDGEGGAFSLFAFHVNGAVHQLDDAPGDRHAKARAAVFAGGGGILLAEGIKEVRQEFRTHADARIPECHLQRGLAAETLAFLDQEGDRSAFRRELHGVAQDIDDDLAKLEFVSQIIIVNFADGSAVVGEALILALGADHGIDLLQHGGEGEFVVLDDHPPGLDPAHIQDIVDDPQQVLRGHTDFFQMVPGFGRNVRLVEGDAVQADNGVHRRADFVAHTGKEGRFGPAGLLGGVQSFLQGLTLLQQLILQFELLFHFLLAGPVFRVGGFFFQHQPGGFPVLAENIDKQGSQQQRHRAGQNQAPDDDAAGNGINPLADDLFADQIGQQPVGSRDGNIAQGFTDPVVGEGGDAPFAVPEVRSDPVIGIAFVVFHAGQRFQQVVLHGQAAENRVGEGDTVGGVDVAESRV